MKTLHQRFLPGLLPTAIALCVAFLPDVSHGQTADANADADALGVGIGISSANPQAMAGSVAYGGGGGGGGSASLNSEIQLNQVFEAGRRDIMAPTGIAPSVPIPQVFQAPTIPAAAKAIPLSLTYVNRCMPIAGGEADLEEVHVRGISRNTDVVFLPHPNYVAKGELLEEGERRPVDNVRLTFPQASGNYECLGIMSVVARKRKADHVQMFGVLNDAQHFVKNELSGFPNVELLCAQNAVGANIGFKSGGLSGALSAGQSHLGGSSNSLGTLLGGLTGLSSQTYPGVQLGMTCIVVTSDGETEIDISELNKSFGSFVAAAPARRTPVNGNGGKKEYGLEEQQSESTQ